MKKICAFLLLVGVIFCGAAIATPIEVGTGVNAANVTINWKDGYVAEFMVRFDGAPKGMDMLHVIATGLSNFTLTTAYNGAFVDCLAYNGHSNDGFASPDDWWHYWVNNGEGWTSPDYGASSRTVTNGASDGWVYGNANAPVPEPATMALVGLGAVMMMRRRK